jgi:tagatose-6-phosphate ketose/aldose isomerase
MKILGIDEKVLKEKNAFNTANEISGQPELWKNIATKVIQEQKEIQLFISSVSSKVQRIILTGAGTSAYIGMSVRSIFQNQFNIITEDIPTTQIVTHPSAYLISSIPTLVISFARSGNSPESIAAVQLADSIIKNCYHLIITCDSDGKLARYNPKSEHYKFILPKEANDKSLAMTGSYTGMMLAAMMIAHVKGLNEILPQVELLQQYVRLAITKYAKTLQKISSKDFKRAVFLGSGPLIGVATEGHLKLQELTDGKIICKNDSFLGFRHGPKAVTNKDTLLIYIFSSSAYVHLYEKDLVNDMKNGQKALAEIGISLIKPKPGILDYELYFTDTENLLREEFLAVISIVPCQMLAFFKSLQLGLQPDSPSTSGAISRVVKGVKIYQQ